MPSSNRVATPWPKRGAAIAGEHPARAVAAVRGGREAHQQQSRARITEARQRAGPVALARVARRRRHGDAFAVGDQPGTATAADDAGVEMVERASILQSGGIVTRSGSDRLWEVQVRGIARRRAA